MHLLSCLLLLLLVREALVVSSLQLLVQTLYEGQRHARHQLQLPRIYHRDLGVTAGESDYCAGQVELVNVEETLLLYAEVREELGIASQVLRVLLCDLSRHIRRLCPLLLLWMHCTLNSVCIKETTLVDEYVHIVENSVP